MSSTTNPQTNAGSPPTEGVADAARNEAGQLKDTSVDAARQVAGTVKEKASDVTSDAREQTRRLAGQTRDELVSQAGQQKERAANSIRAVGDELRGMAEHGQSGLGSQLARHGAEFTDQAADFLQRHEPGELLEEVRGYARRKPGTFLLVAAAAGVVAGRLTRALSAGATDSPSGSGSPSNFGTSGQSANGTAGDDYLVPPPGAPVGGPYSGPVGGPPPGGPVGGPPPSGPMGGPPSAPAGAPPVGQTSPPPPMPTTPPTPTPVAPNPDPGAPVTPRFGPGPVQ